MPLLSLTNAKILAGPADLSGWSNTVELEAEAEEKDVTTFGATGFRSFLGGMKQVMVKSAGFWEAGSAVLPDDRFWTDLGVSAVPMTVTPTGATVGDVSYITRVTRLKYNFGDKVGEILPFESEANGDGTALVRGLVADNQVRTVTGTTAIRTLVAPTATTRVYAAIHVVAVSGTSPSLTATLQGDDAIGFPSPATVATSSAITAPGSIWLVGPYGVSLDSFFRLSYTISGTSPQFSVIATIGIGT